MEASRMPGIDVEGEPRTLFSPSYIGHMFSFVDQFGRTASSFADAEDDLREMLSLMVESMTAEDQ